MSTSTAAAAPSVADGLVAALAGAWRAIRSHHPDVPDAVLTVAPTGWGRDTVPGHLARGTWPRASAGDAGVGELVVAEEALRAGASAVLDDLLHQAAHGLAAARGISDTSRQGRYHNAKFRGVAEELGLLVEEDGNRGWAATIVPRAVSDRYADALKQLEAAIAAQPTMPAPASRPKSWQRVTAQCRCPRPRKFTIPRTTLELGPIVCGKCRFEFTEVTSTR